jgi:hypothetical protein
VPAARFVNSDVGHRHRRTRDGYDLSIHVSGVIRDKRLPAAFFRFGGTQEQPAFIIA